MGLGRLLGKRLLRVVEGFLEKLQTKNAKGIEGEI